MDPIHSAAERGDLEVIRLLLEAKADVYMSDIWDSTALHIASPEGHEEIVKLLSDYHANLNATNWLSETPLHLASRSNTPALIAILIMAGANPLLLDGYSHTSLDWASMHRPCFEAMGPWTKNYTATPQSIRHSRLKVTLIESVKELLEIPFIHALQYAGSCPPIPR